MLRGEERYGRGAGGLPALHLEVGTAGAEVSEGTVPQGATKQEAEAIAVGIPMNGGPGS